MLLNPKGGCGKTTLAANLASCYALAGEPVTLVDFDPQGSAADWFEVRPADRPPIRCVTVDNEKDGFMLPLAKGNLIMDVPAGTHGKLMKRYVKLAQTVIIPVLPSPVDIRATARFIHDLLLVGRISREKTRVAVVANRVRENTRVYHALQRFLTSLDIPFIATLRDSQNYIRAAERGLGIFELPSAQVSVDIEQWQPLLKWLASTQATVKRKSKPNKVAAGQR